MPTHTHFVHLAHTPTHTFYLLFSMWPFLFVFQFVLLPRILIYKHCKASVKGSPSMQSENMAAILDARESSPFIFYHCMIACLYPDCSPVCMHIYRLSIGIPACMSVCLLACIHACMSVYLPACPLACLPLCTFACLPAWLHDYIYLRLSVLACM